MNNESKTISINICGSLYVNSVKFDDVDEIILTDKEMLICTNKYKIGSILRENINSLFERNYVKSITTDLLDNLIHIVDICKPGDFG